MFFVILLPNVLSVSQPIINTFRSSSPLFVGLPFFGLYRCDQSTVPLGSFFCPYFILACGGSRRSTPFHFSSCFDPARNVKCLRLCFGFSGAYLDIFDSPFGSNRFFCAVFERGLLSRSYRSVVLSSPPDSLIASLHSSSCMSFFFSYFFVFVTMTKRSILRCVILINFSRSSVVRVLAPHIIVGVTPETKRRSLH